MVLRLPAMILFSRVSAVIVSRRYYVQGDCHLYQEYRQTVKQKCAHTGAKNTRKYIGRGE